MDEKEIKEIITRRRKELERFKPTFMEKQKGVRPSRDLSSTYESCKQELTENPWNLSALRSLAQSAYNSKEYALAIYLLDDLARSADQPDPDQKIKTALGFAYYDYGVLLLAEEKWEDSQKNLLKSKDILKTYDGKDEKKIQKINETIIDIDIKIPTAQYANVKKIEDLEKIRGQSAKLDKQDWEGLRDFSGLEETLNNKDETPSKRAKAAQEIAGHLLNRREYDKALEYLKKAEPIDPSSDTAKMILNTRYRMLDSKNPEKKELEALANDYKILNEKRPNDPDVSMALGKIDFTLKRWLEVIKTVQKNMPSAENQKIEAELMIADSLLELNQSPAAELQFKKTAKRTREKENKDYVHAMYGLGISQEKQDKKDKAKKSFSEVIRLDIGYKDALERLNNLQEQDKHI